VFHLRDVTLGDPRHLGKLHLGQAFLVACAGELPFLEVPRPSSARMPRATRPYR
jgi:hypothetical protein